jgi:hypothetical protein
MYLRTQQLVQTTWKRSRDVSESLGELGLLAFSGEFYVMA